MIRLLLFCAFCSFATATELPISKLESFIEEAMEQSGVPGVSVGIVQEGKLVYANGFGCRNLEKKEPATAGTIFQLASLSKPITSTILALLVAEDKFSWDSKITDLDPSFSLF